MTDIPVIMSAPMVLALLREIEEPGTGKTMTRRLSGKEHRGPGSWRPSQWANVSAGDRLWVRESFFAFGRWRHMPTVNTRYEFIRKAGSGVIYAEGASKLAGEEMGRFGQQENAWHLRPSIFLRREDSRLTLIVAAAWIERLHAITEADAIAEGIVRLDDKTWGLPGKGMPQSFNGGPIGAFSSLWMSLHGSLASWQDNPEVVAVSFRPVLGNIDTIERAAA